MKFQQAQDYLNAQPIIKRTYKGMRASWENTDVNSYCSMIKKASIAAARQSAEIFENSSDNFDEFISFYNNYQGSVSKLITSEKTPFYSIPFARIDNLPVSGQKWMYLESNQQGQGYAALPDPLLDDISEALLRSFMQIYNLTADSMSLVIIPRSGDALLGESITLLKLAHKLGINGEICVKPEEKEEIEHGAVIVNESSFNSAIVTGGVPPDIKNVFPQPTANMVTDHKGLQRIILKYYEDKAGVPINQKKFGVAFNENELYDYVDALEGVVVCKNFLFGSAKGVYFVESSTDLDWIMPAFRLDQLYLHTYKFEDYGFYPVCVEQAIISEKYNYKGSRRIHDGTIFTPGIALTGIGRVGISPFTDHSMDSIRAHYTSLNSSLKNEFRELHDMVFNEDGKINYPVDHILRKYDNIFKQAHHFVNKYNDLIRNQYIVSAGYNDDQGIMHVDTDRVFLMGSNKMSTYAEIGGSQEVVENILQHTNLVITCLEKGIRQLKVPNVLTPHTIRNAVKDSIFASYIR